MPSGIFEEWENGSEHSQDIWSYNKLLIDLASSVSTSEISYLFSSRTLVRTKKVGPIFHQHRPHAWSISSKYGPSLVFGY